MKATVYGLLAAVVTLAVLAMPRNALAHDHHGWHHDNGNHWGWYKHQGGYGYGGYGSGGYPGWHHHEHEWYEHHGYAGYPGNYGYGGYPGNSGYGGYPGYGGPGYYGAYPGGMACDDDGDDCGPVSPPSMPFMSGYGPGSYYGSGYYGQGGYGPGAYAGYMPNAGKLMQLQQTMSQRLSANQALYQAAMARGNYALANKAAARMQNQSATISAANAMMGGAGAAPGYPAYGASPYYGQSGASPLGSILQMLGY